MSAWWAELKRRRVFRAMGAYVVGAWIVIQVASTTFGPLGFPDWSQRALILALAAGVVPAFVLAWVYDFTSRGIVRTEEATASVTIPAHPAAFADVGVAAPAPLPADASVAVLPFADLSVAKDQSWFCDGLAEEIIDALCTVRRLRVSARTASFRFRDGSVDPREIGRLLGVGAILEGSVRRSGDRARITAQLIDASTGYHLWSESYEHGLEDVFAIQSEIARKVAAALRINLTGDECVRCEKYAPRNAQAHEFYLRGRQLARLATVTSWAQAPAMFRRAIELDPEYAAAYAGLVDILSQLVLWRLEPVAELVPEVSRAAHRALELAPDLAESHVAVAHARWLAGDDAGAERSFERALELDPELHDALYYYARHCFTRGLHERAADLYVRAWQARPDDFTVLAMATSALDGAGRHERAIETARVAAEGLRHQAELDPDNPRVHYLLAGALATIGRAAEGLPHMETALRLRPDEFATLYNGACYFCLAGDTERALELVARAVDTGVGNVAWLEHDHDLAPLHGDPRFTALVARLARGRSD